MYTRIDKLVGMVQQIKQTADSASWKSPTDYQESMMGYQVMSASACTHVCLQLYRRCIQPSIFRHSEQRNEWYCWSLERSEGPLVAVAEQFYCRLR